VVTMEVAATATVERLRRRLARERKGRLVAEEVAERATREALHDSLTGLANRSLFMDRLELALSARDARTPAVFFIDLDRFKLVNDSLGHAAGDALLIEVAKRLRDSVRPADTVARLGGDEFTILCESCADHRMANEIAGRLNVALAPPVMLAGKPVFTSASIGIVLADERSAGAEDLMRDADTAMYAAKRRGKARYEIFDAGMRGQAMERLELEVDLRRAIELDEIEAHYQPLVDVQTGRIVGLEALARWRHPVRGLVAPSEFLPVCEETGLIVPLGHRLLRDACHRVQRWREALGPGAELALSVNVSIAELGQADLVGEVADALQASGSEPSTLCLEITEHALMGEASGCLENLRALDALGVHLALDDFGTGYSSLAYLKRLPIDTLKIDRSFMVGVGNEPADSAILEAIFGLARALGLSTVAEGIESATQWMELRRLGCETAQGYLFSRPLPAHGIEDLLQSRTRPRGAGLPGIGFSG
jgi:diguanylate cyclase (GGDEF)-like protein